MLNILTFRIDSYVLSRGVHSVIIDTYPTPPIYVLPSLQGQFIGFQDFTLFLKARVSYSCISSGNISQIFDPKYNMLSKPLNTVSFLGILKKSLCPFPLKRIND